MKKSLLLLSSFVLFSGLSFAGGNYEFKVAENSNKAIQSSRIKALPGSSQKKSPAAKAEGDDTEELQMNFGYADEVYSALSFTNATAGQKVVLAFEIPVADQQPLIGSKITDLNITTGTNANERNSVRDIYMFVTDDISKPLSTDEMTSVRLGVLEFHEYTYPLTTPFEIKGDKPLYVGYTFDVPKATDQAAYIPIDYIPTNQSSGLCCILEDYSVVPKFQNVASTYGSICMSAHLVGETLPTDDGILLNVYPEDYAKPTGKTSYKLLLKNVAANSIKNITVKTEIGNGSTSESTVTLAEPLAPNGRQEVEITDATNNSAGVYSMKVTLTKVNGKDVTSEPLTTSIAEYETGYKRYSVVEEGTSTYCVWCPMGIVSMGLFKETYPDWILVAVHGNMQNGNDPMTITGYDGFLQDYIPGYPSAVINRAYELPIDGTTKNTGIYSEYFNSFPSYADIELSATMAENMKTVNISSKTNFSTSSDVAHLISFVITEDNVGPYSQINGFSGSGISMDGWENKNNPVETMYDEVARNIKSYPGIRNSLPEKVEADKEYTYDTTMSTTKVTGDKFTLIGLVTNALTGEIINAKKVEVQKTVGVEGISADETEMNITVVGGEIVVAGAENVAVYTLDGRRVASNGLSTGVYIVTADGKAQKVLVK